MSHTAPADRALSGREPGEHMQQSTQGSAAGWIAWLPVAWLCLVMVLSARGIDGGVSFLLGFSASDSVFYFVVASAAFGAVAILWGLWLLWLVYRRSPRFPRQYTIWQSVVIAGTVIKQAYIMVAPNFAITVWSGAIVAAEIAVGIAMIALVNRSPSPSAAVSGAAPVEDGPAPHVLLVALVAVLGVLVGGAVGAGLGLLIGSVIAEVAEISCFEGGCGYFVVLIGIVGCLVGAIAGGILAVWLTLRRRRLA